MHHNGNKYENKYKSPLQRSLMLCWGRVNRPFPSIICQKTLPFTFWCTIIFTEHQYNWCSFLSKGYTGWFAIAFPAVVGGGIMNLVMVMAIACILFAKDTVESETPPTNAGRRDTQFNIHPRDSTYIDESPCLWNTSMTVYSWVGIQTQAWQLGASVRTSRLSCRDVAIHWFVTENIFYSL